MKNVNMHFWDSPLSHPERDSFRRELSAFGIKTSIDIADLSGVSLLFIHGADSYLLNSYTFQNQVYKVSFGDNATEMKPIFREENRISYINASELFTRFERIYAELETVSELTIETLFIIVFGFDKKLEDLLEPFESTNPYATEFTAKDKAKMSLKDAKAVLQNHVREYLENQSKL